MTRAPLKRGTRISPVSTRMRATLPAKRAMRAAVLARAKGRCEACGRQGALEVHHVQKRSAGGPDTAANGVGLCRACHARTDWPYAKGRLLVTRQPHGGYTFHTVFAANKWAAR